MRHGLPEGGQKLRGKTDDPLSSEGRSQMQKSASELDVDIVFSSPLKRCAEFALEFSQSKKIQFISDDKIAEIDFGDWDGKPYSELFKHRNSQAEQYLSDPWNNSIPNGESLKDFSNRVNTALIDILSKHKGKNILIVTHSGVIRQMIANILNIKSPNANCQQNIKINYASTVKFSIFTDIKNTHFINLEL